MKKTFQRYSIYAVTPNPALDLSGHVSEILPNEKNYVHRPLLHPGGNAVNAARIAKRLGVESLLLGFTGGPTGEQLKTLLCEERLAQQFTNIRGSTRINVTVTNDQDHQQTRLTFPGPAIRKQETQEFMNSVSKLKAPGVLILGGSSPIGCDTKFRQTLIETAQNRGLNVIVDVPVPDLSSILKTLKRKLLLIKPNLSEFEHLLKRKLRGETDIVREASKLNSKAHLVCVSLGEKGAILAMDHDAWLISGPNIRARGCVGAGDSMVGAVAARYSQLVVDKAKLDVHTVLDCFRWGAAAGAATAATEGTSLGPRELIQKLYTKTSVRKL